MLEKSTGESVHEEASITASTKEGSVKHFSAVESPVGYLFGMF